MADDKQSFQGPAAIGTWKTPAMGLQAWQTFAPLMQGTNDINQYQMMTGGPQMQALQYQDNMRRQQAAQQLDQYLALSKQYPGMQPPGSVQQAAGRVFQSPMGGMLNAPTGKSPMPMMSPAQAEPAGKLQQLQTYMQTGMDQPSAMAMMGLKHSSGGLTAGQTMKKNTITDTVQKQIAAGLQWNPQLQSFEKPPEEMTRVSTINNIMAIQKQTGVDLLNDPNVIAALELKYPTPKDTGKGGPGFFGFGGGLDQAVGGIIKGTAGKLYGEGKKFASGIQKRIAPSRADKNARALKVGWSQPEIDDWLGAEPAPTEEE